MNISNLQKLVIVLGMLIASFTSTASIITHSFSYDDSTFSFSLSDQNASYDPQGFFVSTDLVAPKELFTFQSEALGIDIEISDVADFGTFEVYFDEVLSNGIFSFVTEFTSNDLLITLEYDADFDIFDFIVEDLTTGDFIVDVIDVASSLQTDSILVIEDGVMNVDEPSLYFVPLFTICFLLIGNRFAVTG